MTVRAPEGGVAEPTKALSEDHLAILQWVEASPNDGVKATWIARGLGRDAAWVASRLATLGRRGLASHRNSCGWWWIEPAGMAALAEARRSRLAAPGSCDAPDGAGRAGA